MLMVLVIHMIEKGKVFGNIGVKETSTGEPPNQQVPVLVVNLVGNTKIKITNNVDKSTRLYVQGDMSGNVDHKGTSFTDGWEFSTGEQCSCWCGS